MNEFVGHEIYSIITNAHLLIKPLQKINGNSESLVDLEGDKLGELLRSIDRLDKKAPYIINNENSSWLIWYEHLKDSTQITIKNILSRYFHLDSELIKLVTRIENSLFFLQWNMLYDFDRDKTFGVYEIQIRTYLNLIKDLEDYAEENLKKNQYIRSEYIGFKKNSD